MIHDGSILVSSEVIKLYSVWSQIRYVLIPVFVLDVVSKAFSGIGQHKDAGESAEN